MRQASSRTTSWSRCTHRASTERVNFVILVTLTVPITISYWRMRKSRWTVASH